ncbi:MAG: DNA repair protein RecN [Gammaproteobacteria bacterium]|nr:DNA repair protein RecN [Gammaproteobacteria bacterium]MDE0260424.1 DNA repair protein RecN [Gammaproteobacteria bacterium]
MLIELRIRDYAVIDDLTLAGAPGLNAVSGETGSGKSLVANALSCLLGERASPGVVRVGASRAMIEAAFDIEDCGPVRGKLEELGLGADGDVLVLRREVARRGRNRAWVNDSSATVGLLRELGRHLVDLHGQHEHQSLLRPAEQARLLDSLARATGRASAVAALCGELKALERERERLEARIRELEARADFIRFQLGEIEGATLQDGEDTALETEATRLEHADELARNAGGAYEELYAGDAAVTVRIRAVQAALADIIRLDGSLGEVSELLEQSYQAASEAGRFLGDYASSLEHDPRRLEDVRTRLDRIFRLKRKYGPALEDVFETGRRLAAQLEEIETSSFDIATLERRIRQTGARLEREAAALSETRCKAASKLERRVTALFPELGLEGGTFSVALGPLAEVGPGGAERVEFLASLNPGFPPAPLGRIASGGELSRVMLALKSILGAADRVPTLVFDEIDAGVGGEIANAVGARLQETGRAHQVLAITHLAQIASRASHHVLVEKRLSPDDGMIRTRASVLDGGTRVHEIARMLGGDPDSAASREHARELLRVAGQEVAGAVL